MIGWTHVSSHFNGVWTTSFIGSCFSPTTPTQATHPPGHGVEERASCYVHDVELHSEEKAAASRAIPGNMVNTGVTGRSLHLYILFLYFLSTEDTSVWHMHLRCALLLLLFTESTHFFGEFIPASYIKLVKLAHTRIKYFKQQDIFYLDTHRGT